MKRREAPDFYGYIPDGIARPLIFLCMMVNSTSLLLVRGVSSALLLLVGKQYFMWFLVADIFGVNLLLKMVRGDLQYWFPIEGFAGTVTSILMRVIENTVTD